MALGTISDPITFRRPPIILGLLACLAGALLLLEKFVVDLRPIGLLLAIVHFSHLPLQPHYSQKLLADKLMGGKQTDETNSE